MRSRYSAFAKRLPGYLLATWHPAARPADLHLAPSQRWVGLRIISTVDGGPADRTGAVEFEARVESGAGPGRLHEVSRFERVDGRWMYRSGRTVGDGASWG
jgi:SEC-C motif-containing protein